jgi:hypothetical protein
MLPNAPRDETKELYVDLGPKQMPNTMAITQKFVLGNDMSARHNSNCFALTA